MILRPPRFTQTYTLFPYPTLVRSLKPARFHAVDRIVSHIGIHVHPIAIAGGIGLHEPAERGRVHPGFVVPHAERSPRLAGVAEAGRKTGIGNAVFVVGSGPDRKSVVKGKSVSVPVDLGGPRFIKKKTK